MTATPITNTYTYDAITYFDNPIKNLEFLEELTEEETNLFALGYLQACDHFREAMSDSMRKLLSAALEKETEREKDYLLKFVKLLDSLDRSLEGRVRILKEGMSNEFG